MPEPVHVHIGARPEFSPPHGLNDHLIEQSRKLIAKGSKSFSGAAQFFDKPTRSSVYLLYAWCRYCDDAIDGQELGFRKKPVAPCQVDKRAHLIEIEQETARCLDGESGNPVFLGLGHVLAAHAIDARYPFDLLEGLRMDVNERTYRKLDDLLEYCYCVAGAVGIMMANIMGVRTVPHLRSACDLGIAFQHTNIARDVIEDHESGRVYLPSDWLCEYGLTPANLAAPKSRHNLSQVTNRLLDTAGIYYRSAAFGLAALPFRSAWAVATASSVYSAIGQRVRRDGAAAWDQRASVGSLRKLAGAGEGLIAALASSVQRTATALPARDGLWTPPALAPVFSIANPGAQTSVRQPMAQGLSKAGYRDQ